MSIKIGVGLILCKTIGDNGIDRLRVQGVFDKTSQMVSREDVVSDIEDNQSHYYSMYKPNNSTNYEIGPKVHVVTVGKDKYLRTDHNSTPEDNLGELPECI